MKQATRIIVIVAVLAAVVIGFFQYQQSRTAGAGQQQLDALTQEMAKLEAETALLRQQQEEAARLAKMAADARRMAEAQAAREAAERTALVASLNDRLQREATERRAAEEAQARLEAKIRELGDAQLAANRRMAELQAARDAAGATHTADTAEADALRREMEQQQAELARLADENEALKQRQLALLEQQISTEDAIIRVGGEIFLPANEIRSPNFRRRDALLFKQRLHGGD
jgi:chromosome segregation ATPase